MRTLQPVVTAFLILLAMAVSSSVSYALVNDRAITIKSPADVAARRVALVQFLWGRGGFPKDKLPATVQRNVISPVDSLVNLERVDTLHISLDKGLKGLAHHFIPKRKNNRLVVLHLGHVDNCSFNDGLFGEPDIGMRKTLHALLSEGFSVLAVYMPGISIEDCTWGHARLLTIATTGSPLKFFFEPTVVSLNYIKATYPRYKDISMIGLSSGGWTTTICAAIDQRIRLSISVAGTMPLYLSDASILEPEERLDNFYRIAGYPDLYVLGTNDSGRRQIQILNRYEECCYGENRHNKVKASKSYDAAVREYETSVKSVVTKFGGGAFSVIIDDIAPRHMISDWTLRTVIMPALK